MFYQVVCLIEDVEFHSAEWTYESADEISEYCLVVSPFMFREIGSITRGALLYRLRTLFILFVDL